jgi:hypothetical protein
MNAGVSASSISTSTGWNIASSPRPETRRTAPRSTPKPGILSSAVTGPITPISPARAFASSSSEK